jgi:hypothetical protein
LLALRLDARIFRFVQPVIGPIGGAIVIAVHQLISCDPFLGTGGDGAGELLVKLVLPVQVYSRLFPSTVTLISLARSFKAFFLAVS